MDYQSETANLLNERVMVGSKVDAMDAMGREGYHLIEENLQTVIVFNKSI